MLASSVLPSSGQGGSKKCLGVLTLELRLGTDHTLPSCLSALCRCEHTHVQNGCACVLCTTHPTGLMPKGSFPSPQEPTCVLWPIQGPGWGKESCGGGRPQADLS